MLHLPLRNANFDPIGHIDSNVDNTYLFSNGGWADDGLNVRMNLTLDNGSKWVGQATIDAKTIYPANMYDVAQ